MRIPSRERPNASLTEQDRGDAAVTGAADSAGTTAAAPAQAPAKTTAKASAKAAGKTPAQSSDPPENLHRKLHKSHQRSSSDSTTTNAQIASPDSRHPPSASTPSALSTAAAKSNSPTAAKDAAATSSGTAAANRPQQAASSTKPLHQRQSSVTFAPLSQQPLHDIQEHISPTTDTKPLTANAIESSIGTRTSVEPAEANAKSTTQAVAPSRPPAPVRRKSSQQQSRTASKAQAASAPASRSASGEYTAARGSDAMPTTRKIWVKRPEASATTVTVGDDDLVDDVRDMILRKYANSLGRTFDSPDINIRLVPRERQRDRVLAPDELIVRLVDTFYPGGQTMDEALVVDIPRRQSTPRFQNAPHTAAAIYYDDSSNRPSEGGEGYFPPYQGQPSPHLANSNIVQVNGAQPHSMSILNTGQVPPIPSPGGGIRPNRHRSDRPRLGRTHTSSSVLLGTAAAAASGMPLRPRPPHSRTHSSSSDPPLHGGQLPMPITHTGMPKSPAPEHAQPLHADAPPIRASSPRAAARAKKPKKTVEYASNASPGALNGTVPPINVLIVEDNPINLKLLEAFVKRLKVRWSTAMNGRDAVKKWRTGGFHLVLMDIQLPGMNGLEATREIRRLERVNSIGVFSSTPSTPQEELSLELLDKDRLPDRSLFKGPVIIVALTASSLQSDRHEALAAGCNDFLTKVSFSSLSHCIMH